MKGLVAIVALLIVASIVASPVRDAVSGRLSYSWDENGPTNLWVWPTYAHSVKNTSPYYPQTVWTPEPYVWYLCATYDGHFFVSPSDRGSWGPDWMTSINASGYSVGVFLDLLPGRYVLSCEVDQPPQFTLSYYNAVDGGYKWASYVPMSAQSTAGRYERVFTVPEDADLVFIRMCSRDAGWSVPAMTVTDIEIYRID